jgi:hypothetical protein
MLKSTLTPEPDAVGFRAELLELGDEGKCCFNRQRLVIVREEVLGIRSSRTNNKFEPS